MYRTREIPGFEDLQGRLIVRWGDGTRSWAQWLHRQGNKEVEEILPADYEAHFPGYYNVVMSHEQLRRVIGNPSAHREWQRMLSSASGVYLILDKKSGMQYVGSAYGQGGIWSRWSTYAHSAAGGNDLLRQLLDKHPRRERHFQFSILRVLEPSCTKDDVLDQEKLNKRKLGSRAFGLNGN
ncbi:MAG TPA: GIY-YIG nuclease family protein [Steroidobacteraceae bacterium]|nr:GIY-YIG nuclease family protein [Steroidobacteraceae bacterium]